MKFLENSTRFLFHKNSRNDGFVWSFLHRHKISKDILPRPQQEAGDKKAINNHKIYLLEAFIIVWS